MGQQIYQQVNSQLLPKITDELQRALDRPVQLGALEQVTPIGLRLGASSIPATANDPDEMRIKAVEIRFDLADVLLHQQLKLDVTLIEPQVSLEQNAKGDWLETELNLQSGDFAEVRQIQMRNAKVTLKPFLNDRASDTDRQGATLILPLQGVFQIEDDERLDLDLSGALRQGNWEIKGQANLKIEKISLAVTTQNVEIAPFISLLPIPVTVDQGTISGRIQISKSLHQPIALQGVATLKQGALRAEGEPNPISDVAGTLRFDGQKIQVQQGHIRFGKIPFDLKGTIDLQRGLDLRATVPFVSAADFMQTFKLNLPFSVTGALKSNDVRVLGAFNHVIFSGRAEAAQPFQIDRLTVPKAQAQFILDKETDRLTLKQVEFLPNSGGKITANADITLENDQAPLKVNLSAEQLSADALAQLYGLSEVLPTGTLSSTKLGKIEAQVKVAGTGDRPHLQANWQLQGDYPAQGQAIWADKQLRVQDTSLKFAGGTITGAGQMIEGKWQAQINTTPLHLADGTVQIEGTLIDQNWNANIQGSQVQLKAIDPTLPGILDGQVKVAGTLKQISANAIDAVGTLQLSQTNILPQPLTAAFQWDGDRLHIINAETQNNQLSGVVKLGFTGTKPTLEAMDLAVQIREDLAGLFAKFPSVSDAASLTGFASFDGRLTGNLIKPHLIGQLQVDGLALNQFQLEPLTGAVQFTTTGLQLDLKGQQDRIQGWVDRPFQTAAVQVQSDQATLQGRYHQGQLTGTVNKLPLQSVYQLTQASPAIQGVNGLLSGRFNFNALTTNPQGVAQISVTQPTIGTAQINRLGHEQDQLTGTLQYRDRLATLNNGEFQLGKSLYRFNGQALLDKEPQMSASVSVSEGELSDLQMVLAEIQKIQPSLTRQLPELTSLNGRFSGNAALSSSPRSGFSTRFDIQGQDWAWQQYGVREITASGQYDGQQVVMHPLQLKGITYPDSQDKITQNLDTQILLTGQYGSINNGQIQLTNLPLAAIQKWMNVSMPLEGNLSTSATVTGDLNATAIGGDVSLSQLRVKHIPLPETNLGFQYQHDRLKITSLNATPNSPSFQNSLVDPVADSVGAEKFYFAVSAIDFTLPVETLQTYVDSGEIKSPLGFYAQFLDEQALQNVRSALQYPIDVSSVDVAEILNSSTGDAWLFWLGEFIQTKSGENGQAAVEIALVEAAKAKPKNVTLMDVLHHFPIQKVRINTGAVMKLLRSK